MTALPDRPLRGDDASAALADEQRLDELLEWKYDVISAACCARERTGFRKMNLMFVDVTFWVSTATVRALYMPLAPDSPAAPTDRELREMPGDLLDSPVKIDDHLDYGEVRASILPRKIDPDAP